MTRIASTAVVVVSALLSGCGDEAKEAGPSPWAGRSYLLSILEGDWIEPHAVGPEIGPNVPSFLLHISGTTPDELELTLGAGQPQATPETFVQNLCSPTQTVPFSGARYPKVEISAEPIRIHVRREPMNHVPVQVTGSVFHLAMTDILPTGDTPASVGTFSGTMDFREIYRLVTGLGDTVTPKGACDSLGRYLTPVGCEEDPTCWVRCEPCPTENPEPLCLTVKAEALVAVEMPGLEVVPVDEATRDPSCIDPE